MKEKKIQHRVLDSLEQQILNETYKQSLRKVSSKINEPIHNNAINFAKWLQHLDNGITHYNPFTKQESESIGFSPSDCLEDGIYTIEVLYEKWLSLQCNHKWIRTTLNYKRIKKCSNCGKIKQRVEKIK
jgi:hypothetical protein